MGVLSSMTGAPYIAEGNYVTIRYSVDVMLTTDASYGNNVRCDVGCSTVRYCRRLRPRLDGLFPVELPSVGLPAVELLPVELPR